MNALIVEDDPNKLAQLRSFVQDSYPNIGISHAISYNSGLQQILSKPWTFVLLDMQLPTFDKSITEPGGRQRALAGQQILKRMMRENVMSPVIIVTQFERFGEGNQTLSLNELAKVLADSRFPNYIGTVYYNANLSDWKRGLKKCLDFALKS